MLEIHMRCQVHEVRKIKFQGTDRGSKSKKKKHICAFLNYQYTLEGALIVQIKTNQGKYRRNPHLQVQFFKHILMVANA